MISGTKRMNSMMDWNVRPSPDSNFQAKNFEFQGLHLEQPYSAAGCFSQDPASTQNPCTYPGNNRIINIPSSTIVAKKLPLQNTGGSSALQPILPKTSTANKGLGPPKHLWSMPPVSLSAVFVQMTPGATQNSNLIRNVHTSSNVVLQGNTVNPAQNIPKKRGNTYMAMENYNNQSQQICSNSVRTSAYQQACKNSFSPKNQSTLVSYYYANGPPISQASATVPLNSPSSHYLNSQQNFSCATLPIEQNSQNQINGQNSSMTVNVQSQQCASDHVNHAPYNVPNYCVNRTATQILPYTVTNVSGKNAPPPYAAPSEQTNYGQYSLPQPVANITNENVQNYHSPMPDLNITYSAQYSHKGQSVQITRETNTVDSIVCNLSEPGSENQLSNKSTKSSVEFRESLLNRAQAARIVSGDESSTPQTSQTLDPQKRNPSNDLGNFPDNSAKDKRKITKESLALDYKKIRQIELALLKLGDAYKRKWKIFLSAEKKNQASDPSAHNQNLNQSSPCNISQNEPSRVANLALQSSSHDACQNQSFLPVPCDSNQIKDAPFLPQKIDTRLVPILRSLLEGTSDEDMLLNTFFGKKDTHQSKHLAVDGSSSSGLSLSNGDKSENSVNNTVNTPVPNHQISQTNPTQEPLLCIKNDLGLMHTSRSANHQLEKNTAASGGDLFHHLKLNKGALETLGRYFNHGLQSFVQSSTASSESSFSRNKTLEETPDNSHHYISPILMQESEKNIKTGSEQVSDASSSASVLSKRVVVMQEGTNKNTVSGDSFRNGGVCSLEELKTSLALWRMNLPGSLSGPLSESTQSTVSLSSSEDGEDDKKTQQNLENLTNILTENDQARIISGSDETMQSSVPVYLGKNHDAVSSNLSKGSEPQVAIVTPLMLSKENIQIAVQKNSPSFEIPYPAVEEGGVHGLQQFLSTVPHDRKGIQSTICSPSESVKSCKDLYMHQKAVASKQENGIVKDEIGKTCHELSQVIGSHSLKNIKSQLGSRDNLPPGNQVSQKYVQSQTGPDLREARDTDEAAEDNPVLQISSVCTLVKGDAFYNSQIASIFCTSPSQSSMENDTSLKDCMPYPQCNDQQPGILKTESEISVSVSQGNDLLPPPYTLTKTFEGVFKEVPDLKMTQIRKTLDEMNDKNCEVIKNSLLPEGMPFSEKTLEQNVSCSGVYSTDLVSDNQELCQNKDNQFSSNIADDLCAINKEGTTECVSVGKNQKHSGRSIEAPVTLLSDQLTELLEEFPYGIGCLKMLNMTGNNAPMAKSNDRGNKENVQISGKCPDPPDTIDQIKIIILNPQQMKEVFPEQKQQVTNKSENAEDEHLKTNSDDNLTREGISPIKTDKIIDTEVRETSSEATLKKGMLTYCCLSGWLASGYAMEPCSCTLVKESGSKQKVDLCSQSETVVKEKPKASDKCNVDFGLNSQLPISTLDTVTKKVSSGMQSNRTLNKISGHTNANEYEPYRADQATSPLPSLEKLNLQKPKQSNEHIRKELPHHAASQSLKTEMEAVEIDMTHNPMQARENSSTDEAQSLSNTGDVVVSRNSCRTDSCSRPRTEKVVVKSTIDASQHRHIEIEHSTSYEGYKIKGDSSETHMIKGPTLSKGLKRLKAVEGKRKASTIQQNDAINPSNLTSVGSVSRKCENLQSTSTLHAQEHSNVKIRGKIKDLAKRYRYKKGQHKEPISSEHTEHHSERTEHHSECAKPSIKRINLAKYAYSKDKKNAWKCRSSHSDNGKTLTPQKQRVRPPNISKILSPGKETILDANKREKWPERSFSDKKSCFNRRAGKLSISLQREQKKTYLNRVAFRRTAHKTIFLTNLESSQSKSVWHVKSSSLSGCSQDKRKSSSPPQQPEAEKPPMLQFKMCPDILFRNPVAEEEILDAKKLPEKDSAPVTAVKSKREDWLNYAPVKRRKTEENEGQVDDEIPLDAAIKLLDGNDTFGMPPKDSQTTFEIYRKMHLEKRSQSSDSNPLN